MPDALLARGVDAILRLDNDQPVDEGVIELGKRSAPEPARRARGALRPAGRGRRFGGLGKPSAVVA